MLKEQRRSARRKPRQEEACLVLRVEEWLREARRDLGRVILSLSPPFACVIVRQSRRLSSGSEEVIEDRWVTVFICISQGGKAKPELGQ